MTKEIDGLDFDVAENYEDGSGTVRIIDENVRNLTFSDNTKKIPYNACAYRYQLKNVIFNEGLEVIGDSAFQNCSELTAIEFPDSLKRIESWAFAHCKTLGAVVVNKKVKIMPNAFGKNAPCFKIGKDHKLIIQETRIAGNGWTDYNFKKRCKEIKNRLKELNLSKLGKLSKDEIENIQQQVDQILDDVCPVWNIEEYRAKNLVWQKRKQMAQQVKPAEPATETDATKEKITEIVKRSIIGAQACNLSEEKLTEIINNATDEIMQTTKKKGRGI